MPVHKTDTVDAEKTSVVPQSPVPPPAAAGCRTCRPQSQVQQGSTEREDQRIYIYIPKGTKGRVQKHRQLKSPMSKNWLAQPGYNGLGFLGPSQDNQDCNDCAACKGNTARFEVGLGIGKFLQGTERWETARNINRHVKECKKQQPNGFL